MNSGTRTLSRLASIVCILLVFAIVAPGLLALERERPDQGVGEKVTQWLEHFWSKVTTSLPESGTVPETEGKVPADPDGASPSTAYPHTDPFGVN